MDKNSSDDTDTGAGNSKTKRVRRRPVDDNASDPGYDFSDTSSSRRTSNRSRDNSRDNYNSNNNGFSDSETDLQNALTTPIGPIALLYRGIAASVPANYQLSAGDEIRIRVESPTLEPTVTKKIVDARGAITLDNIGEVVVRGQSISSAEKSGDLSASLLQGCSCLHRNRPIAHDADPRQRGGL